MDNQTSAVPGTESLTGMTYWIDYARANWTTIRREPGFSAYDPGITPRGPYVLVQEYRKPSKTAGGIMLPKDVQDFNQAVVAVGLVLALGSGCYRHSDGEPWAEGSWCAVGDYVSIPKMSDEKWVVGDATFQRTDGKDGDGAIFRLVRHDHVRGVFTDLALIPTFNKQVA